MPVLSKEVMPYGNIVDKGFAYHHNFQSVGIGLIEILKQL
jgi:hypothetical protein